MWVRFSENSLVSHLYFGDGVVHSVKDGYYIVKFGDDYKNILIGHESLQKRSYRWDEKDKAEAKKYIKAEARKRGSTWSRKFL